MPEQQLTTQNVGFINPSKMSLIDCKFSQPQGKQSFHDVLTSSPA